jgi:hypothetical protein
LYQRPSPSSGKVSSKLPKIMQNGWKALLAILMVRRDRQDHGIFHEYR